MRLLYQGLCSIEILNLTVGLGNSLRAIKVLNLTVELGNSLRSIEVLNLTVELGNSLDFLSSKFAFIKKNCLICSFFLVLKYCITTRNLAFEFS